MHLRIAFLVTVAVDGGAAINVASTMVPSRIVRPLFAKCSLISLKTRRVRLFASNRRRNLSSVVSSGADSCVRLMPAKLRTDFRRVEHASNFFKTASSGCTFASSRRKRTTSLSSLSFLTETVVNYRHCPRAAVCRSCQDLES